MKPGSTEVVVGDGTVGLLGVLSAKQMGAERIAMAGTSSDRNALVTSEHPRSGHRSALGRDRSE